MKQLTIKIRTLAPVVLSSMSNATVMTASHTYFRGSVVRGILAKQYIREQKLGEHAEENDEFLSLFFDKLRFTAAYPMTADGKRTFFLPLSLQKNKNGKEILDLLRDEGKAGFKTIAGFGVITDDAIVPVNVYKTINLHMSRSDQKNKDGKERLAGRSLAGGIYNYEAIDAGQNFMGIIYGEEAELKKLRNGITKNSWQAQVGRSRFTQYGACKITLGSISDIPVNAFEPKDGAVCLRVETPVIPFKPLTKLNDALTALLMEMEQRACYIAATFDADSSQLHFSIDTKPHSFFGKTEMIENFVGIWGMKRPREQALAAGTVFYLRKKEGSWTEHDKDALQNVLYEGVGKRTEEGFGQLRIYNVVPKKLLTGQSKVLADSSVEHLSEIVKKQAENIIMKHFASQMQVWAAEDVQAAKRYFPENGAHFLARLDALLGGQAVNSKEHLAMGIRYEKGNGATPFAKGLQMITIKERKLGYYLTEANLSEMPYNKRDWQNIAEEMNLNEAMQAVGLTGEIQKIQSSEELFYNYWHWFFRYGRKAAAGAMKGDKA